MTISAVLPDGNQQTTDYVYGASLDLGDAINSNDILVNVQHPDLSSGSPSESDSQQEWFFVDALGERTSYTDRNYSLHVYTYDAVGRLTSDAFNPITSGADATVQTLGYTYDFAGRPYQFTSYGDEDAVVNQVERLYNGLGQLITEYQENSGTVDGSSVKVQYTYSETDGGTDNHSRLTSIIYPNGREIDYNYNGTDLDDAISRLSSISNANDATVLEGYQYLGLGTVIERDHPETGINLTYLYITGDPGQAGDQYSGLDRFGRVVDQQWVFAIYGIDVDEQQYGYDADGNVLWRKDDVNENQNDEYSYDILNRLTDFTGDSVPGQSWNLDALGNWNSLTTTNPGDDPIEEDRAAQRSESDHIGRRDERELRCQRQSDHRSERQHLHLRRLDRLVSVYDNASNLLAAYKYDALARRIVETHGANTSNLYYSDQSQVLEEQNGSGDTTNQYVWSPVYVNALIERDRDSDNDPETGGLGVEGSGLDERLYVTQDANYNTTALIAPDGEGGGSVVERFEYDPYGTVTASMKTSALVTAALTTRGNTSSKASVTIQLTTSI